LKTRFLSFCSLFLVGSLEAADVVFDDKPYFKYDTKNLEIIYTKEHLPFAKHTAKEEMLIKQKYSDIYNWDLDEKLYVGLISSNNQIANAFSSQYPNNRQINYMGGTLLVDEFASISWLDTLLYHEGAHNYQMNMKGSEVSQTLHKYFGNGMVLFPYPIILPNLMENSFLTEGNAVLSESLFGNGGRLYNGFYKAETIIQAHENKIKPALVYNKTLNFPYGDISYIQGGFYQLYLAQKYGLKKTNSYFMNHSLYYYWPFLTNKPMQESIGVNFEDSLKDFSNYYKKLYKSGFRIATGLPVATSHFFAPLSKDKENIYFLASPNKASKPMVIVFNKKEQSVTMIPQSLKLGKLFKIGGKYYSVASVLNKPNKITQALYDEDLKMESATDSKVVQGFLSSHKMVYFDVKKSFYKPQLYVDGKFYATTSSSAFVDKNDNIYYFKQKGKKRTLYKNKRALYSYQGYFGIVSDVDSKGNIYFIANSALGSTLYMLDIRQHRVFRVLDADNIRDAKLLNDKEVFVSAIGADNYYYIVQKLIKKAQKSYNTRFFFEKQTKQKQPKISLEGFKNPKPYLPKYERHYSATNIAYITFDDFQTDIEVNFEDPLGFNRVTLFYTKDSYTTVGGITYENYQHRLSYNVSLYGTIDNNYKTNRDITLSGGANYPLFVKGYQKGSLEFDYFQDYQTQEREPISVGFLWDKTKKYGLSLFNNEQYSMAIYGAKERDDYALNAEFSFMHDILEELYLGLDFHTLYTTAGSSYGVQRGIKLTHLANTNDKVSVSMPSLDISYYVKGVTYTDVALYKTLYFSQYYFTFPFSLQREALYSKYRHYDIENFKSKHYNVDELTFGVQLQTVFANSFELPIKVEYIYNNASFIQDSWQFKVTLGVDF